MLYAWNHGGIDEPEFYASIGLFEQYFKVLDAEFADAPPQTLGWYLDGIKDRINDWQQVRQLALDFVEEDGITHHEAVVEILDQARKLGQIQDADHYAWLGMQIEKCVICASTQGIDCDGAMHDHFSRMSWLADNATDAERAMLLTEWEERNGKVAALLDW